MAVFCPVISIVLDIVNFLSLYWLFLLFPFLGVIIKKSCSSQCPEIYGSFVQREKA